MKLFLKLLYSFTIFEVILVTGRQSAAVRYTLPMMEVTMYNFHCTARNYVHRLTYLMFLGNLNTEPLPKV